MLNAEAKRMASSRVEELMRAAMFMGVVAQKSLLDVVTEPEKPEPEKPELLEKHGLREVCKSCQFFVENKHGGAVGMCERDSSYALESAKACEHWERMSSKGTFKSKESTGDVQLLVEAHRNYLKALIA